MRSSHLIAIVATVLLALGIWLFGADSGTDEDPQLDFHPNSASQEKKDGGAGRSDEDAINSVEFEPVPEERPEGGESKDDAASSSGEEPEPPQEPEVTLPFEPFPTREYESVLEEIGHLPFYRGKHAMPISTYKEWLANTLGNPRQLMGDVHPSDHAAAIEHTVEVLLEKAGKRQDELTEMDRKVLGELRTAMMFHARLFGKWRYAAENREKFQSGEPERIRRLAKSAKSSSKEELNRIYQEAYRHFLPQ